MSVHRITSRQREWSEVLNAALLAALISCAVLVNSVFSQQPGQPATDDAPTQSDQADETPEDQEYTGPPLTHVLGMSIADARPTGAIVQKVDVTGPAAEAGVKRGDILTEVAGKKTQPYDKFLELLRDAIEKRTKGDSVPITVLREGESQQLTLTERTGSEERKDDIKELAEEYSEKQEAERKAESQDTAAEQSGSLADAIMDQRDRGSDEDKPTDTASLSELLGGGGVQQPADNDYDYYFGSGGFYGGALTSVQQNELDRLMRMQDRNGLTNAQQQRLDELSQLEFGQFDRLGELNPDEQTELDELFARRRGGDELGADERVRLRQLIGRRFGSEGDYQRSLQQLEQMSERGELNNRQQMRLDMLRELGPNPGERVNETSLQQLRELVGDDYQSLDGQQLQRMQELAARRSDLTPQDMAELRQLRLQNQSQLARQLRNEYQSAQRMLRSGQQFNPQQAARFQQLQRNLNRFSAGVPRGAVPYPNAAMQPGGAPAGGPAGAGGAAGPSSPASGSGIGTASGPGVGSAPSGGIISGDQ
ncbi:hypothetical protein KOR34_34670 [Posidoniimonas corsicana]|uniref:PDZ domain-containing protein n=1 Tax=Posidoniimonas corsicana TaxID=1938618 RepID=A0A5C5V519_9BACT|nr:PDZ domain-containing protein [Posidoniimonas corsicana]TWT33634.1 hypothetical protein KOR34_34670 [Posidoniimonas corsicana]